MVQFAINTANNKEEKMKFSHLDADGRQLENDIFMQAADADSFTDNLRYTTAVDCNAQVHVHFLICGNEKN